MSQQIVNQLPADTIKLITSTQIVTSVSTAVKELVENSIDAGAKVVQIRLENFGLDLIEVKDDGSGVSYDNVQRMFLPGYTSKIRKFEDLDNLYSYGFRGEALAALCKIAKVSITTKTQQDTLAMIYEIDSSGLPTSSKPTHLNNGTIITVSNLFSNLPVRRLFLSSKKKLSEELKKTEQVIQSLSLIHPQLQVSLIHNKSSIWRKNSIRDIKQSFMQVAGLRIVSKMEYLNKSVNQVNVALIVPKKNLDNIENIFTNSNQSIYTYINKRPIICKNLFQPVLEHIFHHFSNLNISQKYSTCFISVEISPQQMDINLEPNKTKVLLKNETDIIKVIDEALSNYYEHEDFTCTYLKNLIIEEIAINEEPEEQPAKRPKIDKAVGERRNEIFKEKNKDWTLEIINDDCQVNCSKEVEEVAKPLSLCSQINNTNSILTTEEISEFNTIRNDSNVHYITTTNSKNSETRLVDRNDIQSRNLEKPILQAWPCRPKVIIECPPEENKKLEVISEVEEEAEKWSSDMIQAMKSEQNEVVEVEKEEKLEEEAGRFDLSLQSISSQMGKKELKGFTKFARIMRPKIVEELPNLMFTEVAGILAKRWKDLKPDEVKYYEKMAEVVDSNRRIHQEEKESKPPPKLPKPKAKPTKTDIEQIKIKSKINRPPRKETPLEVSISLVKKLGKKCETPSLKEDYSVIGQLQPSGNWLYIKGRELGHIRHQGLQELITSQKMLSSHTIPKKQLDKPIVVSQDNLGSVLWNVLISLDVEFDKSSSKYLITDDVITKNGFSIEVVKENEVICLAVIFEVALCIPHFGISELKDALNLYLQNGEIGGLATWRPTAVCNYITNEAIRTSQQHTNPPPIQEVQEMLNIYHLCLRHLPPICLHSKEIFPVIYSMEKVESDQ